MFDDLLFLDDPELWKGVAFFISIAVVCIPIYRALIVWVKKRAGQISFHWQQALTLRQEAETLLRTAQSKNFYKANKRKKIVQHALKEARILKENANKELKDRL